VKVAKKSFLLMAFLVGSVVLLTSCGKQEKAKGFQEQVQEESVAQMEGMPHEQAEVQTPTGGKHQAFERGGVSREEAPGKSGKTLYQCPMHPTYISEEPGDCPICGMKLVPVEGTEPEEARGTPGLATVRITSEKQQLIGVRTGLVRYVDMEKIIRTVGRVTYAEPNVAYVTTKFEGWIEELYVDYTGKRVRKGQPLFTIYSPELVSTQEEYLLALKAQEYLTRSGFSEVSSGANNLLESTRRRLLLWDITEKDIRELERTGKPRKTLTIYSPIDGYVIHKNVFRGMKVSPGLNLYHIVDLSTVWVEADIYEYEIPFVKVGQEATISLSYCPGETFSGKVTYIYPYLESKTRTVKVRMEFPNRDLKLKPEMYANVELKVRLGRKLAVPEEAVLNAGTRQYVFVDLGDGRFEPREVRLGPKADAYVAVLEGLREGERVVTSANFLIDSESKLRAALTAMGGHQH